MKHMVCVSWTLTDILPDHVIDDLRSVVIRTDENPLFRRIDCLAGDPLVDEAIAMLEAAGAVRHTTGRHMPNEYTLAHRREWEPADADNAEYLWLTLDDSEVTIAAETKTDGTALVPATDLAGKRHQLVGRDDVVLCSDDVAARLSTGKFEHMRFLPVKIALGQANLAQWQTRAKGHESWWQLSSDLILPPFAPAVIKRKPNSSEIVSREYMGRVRCVEPPFRNLQPVYLRSEWERVPKFDVAATFEHEINPPEFKRRLIVSKRFYEFCKKEGLQADWVPVRFE